MWEHSHQAKMEMAFNLMCGNLKCPLDSFLSDDEAVIFLNYKIYFFYTLDGRSEISRLISLKFK